MRLERDRLTWLTYLQLGAYGYFLYGFGPALSLLRDEQGTSRSVAGLHGTALAVGSLVSALVTARLVSRYGRTAVVWAGLLTLAAGISLFTATTALPATLAGALVGSFGGSFVVVLCAPVLIDRHGETGPSAVAEANALAAGVGTLAPLAIGAAVGLGLGWRPGVLVLLPVIAVLGIVGRGVRAPRPAAQQVGRQGRLPRHYWIRWVVVTAGIAIEFCLVLWTADVLRERMGLSPGLAAAGVTGIVAGMSAGRLAGGRLALRYPLDALLYAAIGLTSVSFAVFWLTTDAWLAIPALAACGVGIAMFYPLGIARAIDASDGRPDHASARVGIGAALAAGGGPFALGALADLLGLHLALLVVPALLCVAAVGLRLGRVAEAEFESVPARPRRPPS